MDRVNMQIERLVRENVELKDRVKRRDRQLDDCENDIKNRDKTIVEQKECIENLTSSNKVPHEHTPNNIHSNLFITLLFYVFLSFFVINFIQEIFNMVFR